MEILIILLTCSLNLINAGMDYICDNIFLGDNIAARNETYLKENNISAVVNCAKDLISNYIEIKFLELSLYDDTIELIIPKFEVAYKFIKEYSDNNILIHCLQGKSRSVSLVVFYLMKEKGWDYDTCITFIKERRPSISPNIGFVEQLKEYYDKYIKE